MSDEENLPNSPPQSMDSYYRLGNFEDPSPIIYPAANNGYVSNFNTNVKLRREEIHISTNINTASPKDSTATLSDATVYAFLANQPNGSQLIHEDLEQIHDDDLEEMDLKWQLALLSMRARKFYQRTRKKITINGSDTVGYDKSKVECFNCHKMGHFARECRNPRNQESKPMNHDNWNRNHDSTRRTVNVEDTSSKVMLAIDGVGFDWSDMAEEQIQTNMALIAFSDSELPIKEDQLVTFRKNEILFGKEIAVLKREVGCKDYELGVLKTEFEKVKQEKDGIDFKIAKFDNATKSLDKMLESQITDKSKKGIGYHIVASPHPLSLNAPTKLDLSYSCLDEFKGPEFNGYGPRDTVLKSTTNYDKESDTSEDNTDDSLVHEQVSEDENSSVKSLPKVDKETVFHTVKKYNCPHHQRKMMVNGNNYNKVDYDYYTRTSSPSTHKNMTPRAVLMKSGLKSFSTARHVYTARLVSTARPRVVNTARPYTTSINTVRAYGFNASNPQLDDKGFVDSGCSRHMTRNIAYLLNFKEFDGGYVTFGGGAYGGRITGKGTLKTNSLDFDDVYFLPDENQILLRIPRQDNMYSFDMKNIFPKESLTCLVAKATSNESMLWHRRLGHINFKNINKLVKENLVRGLPLKRFENDQTCVACLKGKQHRASCKSKVLNPITKPLFMLHMDLFGPTFVSSLMHKKYCLVVTDDYSRFTWVFFLATKDETSEILKNFIKEIENLVDKKVKIIRCDNGTEFKNKVMDYFCKEKGIRREYSVARTPKQNGVAERRNRTLIEAARTMLADSKLPTTFWTKAVSTACYVQNRVLIVKPYNKILYEIFRGFKPALSFMKPFGCHVTILNTLDSLGKFDGKSDEGFFVGYSLSSKAFRVYNTRTRKVEENLHIGFLENKPMTKGNGPQWLTQGDPKCRLHLTREKGTSQDGIVMPIWKDASYFDSPSKELDDDDEPKQVEDGPNNESDDKDKSEDDSRSLRKVDLGNIPNSYAVPITPNTRIHKDYPIEHVISDIQSSVQTRRMTKPSSEQGFLSAIYEWKTHKDLHTCLFYCFLSQEEPKRISKALSHRAIGTKWIFRNKKDNRGIVIRNKARLIAQRHTQEEGIDYDEVFAPVARIEAIRLFLAYASFMGFMVYQMDVKSAFLYGQIEQEVYVCQPPGFEDPNYPDKVYKVVKALYGLHQAPRAWYETLANYVLGNGFQRGKIDQILFIKRNKGDILLDKYVDEILRKFNYSDVKSASTLIDLEKPLVKDGDATDVDEHLYRSMIGSLMYLRASRPDIMFAVCACARFQVTPKTSHLLAVKRIFRYLKGKPNLGLWYSKDSPLELVAYTYSDYAGATQDRKSTTEGYQFLGNRLISWQCKKQTVVATSTTEAEYVVVASCCGQVLWIQNQLLDYGYNFMNIVIYIDNNSTICIIENLVQHSKTKYIEIRHHFIRDCNTKKLIQMVKIDTEHNVADLLTKGFDAGRFQYMVSK
ncbi:putative ribonuclease H-like domain-containing protein [Tanacetum coccineum]